MLNLKGSQAVSDAVPRAGSPHQRQGLEPHVLRNIRSEERGVVSDAREPTDNLHKAATDTQAEIKTVHHAEQTQNMCKVVLNVLCKGTHLRYNCAHVGLSAFCWS